jgi:vacuolar-type H+-ATPase subunit H
MEDILDVSKPNPITKKISIDREALFDIIKDIRLNIPSEIKHAQKIIEDHDKIVNDAKNKAKRLLQESENKAMQMTSAHEIYQMAVEQARSLIEDTQEKARTLRLEATEYADKILEQTEETVHRVLKLIDSNYNESTKYYNETLNILRQNREELRKGASV